MYRHVWDPINTHCTHAMWPKVQSKLLKYILAGSANDISNFVSQPSKLQDQHFKLFLPKLQDCNKSRHGQHVSILSLNSTANRQIMETFSALLSPCAGNSPVTAEFNKGQWCGALMFSLICASINVWVNNGEAGDLRRHHAHYHVTVMPLHQCVSRPFPADLS